MLAPLLQSSHLSSSLLIIAAVRRYRAPSNLAPSVALLHLSSPLVSAETQTSTRLVHTLQWAQRIAQHWRASPSPPAQFREYEEEGAFPAYLSPARSSNRLSWFGTTISSSPGGTTTANSSMTELGLATPPPTRSASRLSLSKKSADSSTSISSLMSPYTSAVSEAKHSFDTIFNFLPALDSPDATLLKFAILVTTISRPFITCTMPTFSHSSFPKPSRRFSLRPEDPPAPPLPSTQPAAAHIVHLVPTSRNSLVLPLETFCLSFASPSQSPQTFTAPSRIDMGKPGPAPRPFILPPIVLGEVLPISRKWTIAELIICGALDGPPSKSGLTNRAWLASSNEIHVIGASRAFQKSPVRPNTIVPGGSSTTTYEPHRSSSLRNHAYYSHAEEDENDDGTCHRSQWPTPPSSSSSSPAPSVTASVSADPATTATTKDLGPLSTGMLTPPESDISDSSDTVKKRRGILKWIRRR